MKMLGLHVAFVFHLCGFVIFAEFMMYWLGFYMA